MSTENPANPWIPVKLVLPHPDRGYLVTMEQRKVIKEGGKDLVVRRSIVTQAYCNYEPGAFLLENPVPYWIDGLNRAIDLEVTHYRELPRLEKGQSYDYST